MWKEGEGNGKGEGEGESDRASERGHEGSRDTERMRQEGREGREGGTEHIFSPMCVASVVCNQVFYFFSGVQLISKLVKFWIYGSRLAVVRNVF